LVAFVAELVSALFESFVGDQRLVYLLFGAVRDRSGVSERAGDVSDLLLIRSMNPSCRRRSPVGAKL